MFYKVKNVEALQNFILKIEFQEEIIKYYDVKPLFRKWKTFEILEKDTKLFNQVKVDQGGYGISWNEDIDLSCEELWNNGDLE